MALVDKTSKYGPTNPIGKRGTGELVDLLAFETGAGNVGVASKYGPVQYGKQPNRYEDAV